MVITIEVKSNIKRYKIKTKTVTGTDLIVERSGWINAWNTLILAQAIAQSTPITVAIIIDKRILKRVVMVAR